MLTPTWNLWQRRITLEVRDRFRLQRLDLTGDYRGHGKAAHQAKPEIGLPVALPSALGGARARYRGFRVFECGFHASPHGCNRRGAVGCAALRRPGVKPAPAPLGRASSPDLMAFFMAYFPLWNVPVSS